MGGKGSGTPKAALLNLNGTQISKDGEESQTDFFSFLALPKEVQAHLDKVMTPAQALQFRNHIVRMKVGTSAAIPMLCGGTKCPFKKCPFHTQQNWPLGEHCPVEMMLVQTWMASYIEDLGVDIGSRTEMVLINKLVELDLKDYRANNALSADEDAWTLLKIDISDNGKFQMETTNPHPILSIQSDNHRQRMTILHSLAATREQKWKRAAALKKREDENIGNHFTRLKKALEAAEKRPGASLDEIAADAKAVANDTIEEADWEMPEDQVT